MGIIFVGSCVISFVTFGMTLLPLIFLAATKPDTQSVDEAEGDETYSDKMNSLLHSKVIVKSKVRKAENDLVPLPAVLPSRLDPPTKDGQLIKDRATLPSLSESKTVCPQPTEDAYDGTQAKMLAAHHATKQPKLTSKSKIQHWSVMSISTEKILLPRSKVRTNCTQLDNSWFRSPP